MRPAMKLEYAVFDVNARRAEFPLLDQSINFAQSLIGAAVTNGVEYAAQCNLLR